MANSPIIYGPNGATSLVPGGVTLPGSTSGTIQIQPAASTTSYSLTMPAAQGGASNTLSNDGSGNLSWVTGLPAVGTDGQLLKSMNSTYIQSSYYTPYINYIGNAFAEINTNGWGTRNWQQTVTITIASPGVFTVTSTTGFYNGMPISFTTTGALPTGLTASTTYYITNLGVDGANKFRVSATLGGSDVNTSGTQSGTHTSYPLVPINNTSVALSGLTFSRNTTTPLRDSADFKLVQTNSTVVAGQALAYNITIDPEDQGAVLSIQLDYNASSTFVASSGQTGSDSDLEVALWDATNSILIPVSPKVLTANGSNNWTFKGTCQTSSNSTNYSLMIYIPTMNANATGWTFHFTNVYVGPQHLVQGPPVTDWISYVPTFVGFGTPTNIACFWRRTGDSILLKINFTSGTATATTASMTLPNGLLCDTSKLTTNTNNIVGYGNPNAGTLTQNVLLAPTSNSNTLNFGAQNAGTSGISATTGSNLLGNNTATSMFSTPIPIVGWSSNTLMSNDTDTRVVTAAYSTLSSTTITSGTALKYTTQVFDTHAAYNTSTGQYIVPVSGYYKVSLAGPFLGSSVVDLNLQVNAVTIYATFGTLQSGGRDTNAVIVQCKTGDAITISPNGSGTAGSTNAFLFIEKLTGPSAIAATDSVNGRYFSSTTSLSGSLATIVYATKSWDTHLAYNSSTGIWTCPVSGKYLFNSALATTGTFALNNAVDMQIQQSGSSSQISENLIEAGGIISNLGIQITDEFYCLAGDTIKVQVSSGSTTPSIVSSNNKNYFSWTRIGN